MSCVRAGCPTRRRRQAISASVPQKIPGSDPIFTQSSTTFPAWCVYSRHACHQLAAETAYRSAARLSHGDMVRYVPSVLWSWTIRYFSDRCTERMVVPSAQFFLLSKLPEWNKGGLHHDRAPGDIEPVADFQGEVRRLFVRFNWRRSPKRLIRS
jgi:hypothetical protein